MVYDVMVHHVMVRDVLYDGVRCNGALYIMAYCIRQVFSRVTSALLNFVPKSSKEREKEEREKDRKKKREREKERDRER